MKSKNVIEFNGKRYDALSGTVLGTARPTSPQNVDGVLRNIQNGRAGTASAQHITVLTAPAAGPAPLKPKIHRTSANHAKAHTPQTATTLMRAAVKRPQSGFKHQVTVQTSLQHTVPSLIVQKQSVHSLDPNRLDRAATVTRSPHISRHAAPGQHVDATVAPLAVQPAPAVATPTARPASKPLDMFEHALANAGNYVDLHARKHQFRKHTRHHIASMTAGSFALLLVAGFAIYQNAPSRQLKMASVHAGVSARMPDFKAAGFTYNGAKAAKGTLRVGFSGKDASYQLVQQNTNWSGDDMIQTISSTDASGAPNYTTVQADGTTVYRFDNTNAMWVANGTWYTVTGTGALTNSQITSLVKNI